MSQQLVLNVFTGVWPVCESICCKNAMSRNRHVIIFSRASKNSIYHMNFMSDINWVFSWKRTVKKSVSPHANFNSKMDHLFVHKMMMDWLRFLSRVKTAIPSQIFQGIIFAQCLKKIFVLIWICTRTSIACQGYLILSFDEKITVKNNRVNTSFPRYLFSHKHYATTLGHVLEFTYLGSTPLSPHVSSAKMLLINMDCRRLRTKECWLT